VGGGFEGGEETVEGTSGLVFLGAMVGDRGSLEAGGEYLRAAILVMTTANCRKMQQDESNKKWTFLMRRDVLVKRKLA
jgi:hypothetical protein